MPVSKSQEWALLSPQSHRTDEQRSRWKQWRTNDSQLQRRYDRLISWQANWPQFQFHKSSPETQKLVSAFHRMLSPLPDPPPSHTKLSVLLDLFEYCTPRQLSETVHQNSCCDSYKGLASLIGLNVTLRIFLNIEISIQPKKFLLSLDNVIDTTNWSATVEVILLVSYYLCHQTGKKYERAYKNGNKW